MDVYDVHHQTSTRRTISPLELLGVQSQSSTGISISLLHVSTSKRQKSLDSDPEEMHGTLAWNFRSERKVGHGHGGKFMV